MLSLFFQGHLPGLFYRHSLRSFRKGLQEKLVGSVSTSSGGKFKQYPWHHILCGSILLRPSFMSPFFFFPSIRFSFAALLILVGFRFFFFSNALVTSPFILRITSPLFSSCVR